MKPLHTVSMVLLPEGGGENIWIVKDGVLMTPGRGVLEGITKEAVFEIAESLGHKALSTATLTSMISTRLTKCFSAARPEGIIPVTEVDWRKVWTESLEPLRDG